MEKGGTLDKEGESEGEKRKIIKDRWAYGQRGKDRNKEPLERAKVY